MGTKQKQIAALERAVLKHTMRRLEEWKKQHPEGPIHPDEIGGMESIHGYRMIIACMKLEQARAALKEAA